jgi:anion-transporting  ArsA/GET3 family ATPase
MGDLRRHGLAVRYMIVNDVILEADCDFHRQRMEMQRPYLSLLERECEDGLALIRLPLLPYEVKGIERLREVERILFGSLG